MDLQVPATGFCWSISVSAWGSSTSTRGGFSWASCSAFGGFSSGAGTALGGFSSAHGKRKQTWYLKMSYFAEFIKLTWLDYSVRGRKQGEGLGVQADFTYDGGLLPLLFNGRGDRRRRRVRVPRRCPPNSCGRQLNSHQFQKEELGSRK